MGIDAVQEVKRNQPAEPTTSSENSGQSKTPVAPEGGPTLASRIKGFLQRVGEAQYEANKVEADAQRIAGPALAIGVPLAALTAVNPPAGIAATASLGALFLEGCGLHHMPQAMVDQRKARLQLSLPDVILGNLQKVDPAKYDYFTTDVKGIAEFDQNHNKIIRAFAEFMQMVSVTEQSGELATTAKLRNIIETTGRVLNITEDAALKVLSGIVLGAQADAIRAGASLARAQVKLTNEQTTFLKLLPGLEKDIAAIPKAPSTVIDLSQVQGGQTQTQGQQQEQKQKQDLSPVLTNTNNITTMTTPTGTQVQVPKLEAQPDAVVQFIKDFAEQNKGAYTKAEAVAIAQAFGQYGAFDCNALSGVPEMPNEKSFFVLPETTGAQICKKTS